MPSNSVFRTYYYGQYRYDNYLLDATEAIEANSKLSREGLKQQNQATKLMQAQHEESLAYQEAAGAELSAMRDELSELGDNVRFGFSLLADRLEEQATLFSQAVAQLEEIRRMLKAPRATEATELFEHGEYCFQQGFYDDALEAFLKAEQINKVNYLLQFRIGTLYLEGRNRSCNVIDLPEAEAHLLLATRYAEAQSIQDAKATRYAADAYFRAAKAAYLVGEQNYKAGDEAAMRACLERALGYLSNSQQLWPEYTPSLYWAAKCNALLDNAQKAIQLFEILSDRNRKYYAQAIEDGDFHKISKDIEALFKNAVQNPGLNARAAEAKLMGVRSFLDWAKGVPQLSKCAAIPSAEGFLSTANREIRGTDVDIERLLPAVDKVRADMEGLFERTLMARKKSLAEIEARTSDRVRLENGIERAKHAMSLTEGTTGMGCLFVFLAFIAIDIVFALLLPLIGKAYPEFRNLPAPLLSLLFGGVPLALMIVGFIAGKRVSRNKANRPLRDEVDSNVRSIAEWDLVVRPIVENANTESKMIDGSLADLHSRAQRSPRWQEQTSPPPVVRPSRMGKQMITLTSVGSNKIDVIKTVREVTGFGLKESKDLVDSTPAVIKRGLSPEDANAIQRKFAQAGAMVEIS